MRLVFAIGGVLDEMLDYTPGIFIDLAAVDIRNFFHTLCTQLLGFVPFALRG